MPHLTIAPDFAMPIAFVRAKILRRVFVLLLCVVFVSVFPASVLSQIKKNGATTYSTEDVKSLHQIHTLFLTGTASTWLNLPQPPFNALITVKTKLQEAGFQVVLDSATPHDATMDIQYKEMPNGQFQILSQGTKLSLQTRLHHPQMGEIFSRKFFASTNPIPLKSLYWDAVQNLEEDPYFFYFGEIVKGQLWGQQQASSVLMHMLRRPYQDETGDDLDDEYGKAFLRKRARINAIKKIRQWPKSQTEGILWDLAEHAIPEERSAAVNVLGSIGDTSFLPRLSYIAANDQDTTVRFAIQEAIRLIKSK